VIARALGCVIRTQGDAVIAALPGVRVGDGARIRRGNGSIVPAEVTAVERARVRLAPFGEIAGIAVGDRVEAAPEALLAPAGFALLGRAVDAAGAPLDGGPALAAGAWSVASGEAPAPGDRSATGAPFWTGVRALDALLTIGRGARVGIFGAPGAGKSSLLEAIVANARADAVVLALIGERGREAGRWLERIDARTSIVCATSDRSASERIRAAGVAMAHASVLRARGLDVLLVVDSLARYAAALCERRTAAGEPMGRGGYPAGVWHDLARFLERAGNAAGGSITMVATVLSDGADEREPLADAARSLLDGHVALSATLAHAGRFPAVDVLASASRTMADVVDAAHARAAARVRAALAYLAETADARAMGLGGGNAAGEALVACQPEIETFRRGTEPSPPGATRAALLALAEALAA
jgi:type III secretion protein N (ATPase)